MAPLSPDRYLLKVTLSQETHAKLARIQDLLRHSVPTGDPAAIVDRALTVLLAQLEKAKHASTERPRPRPSARPGRTTSSRHVPATVKRAVWTRDEGRCAFVGQDGRCRATGFLEFHHVVPFARGGPTSVENLQLRCRAHNAYEAARDLGTHAGLLSISGAGGLCLDRGREKELSVAINRVTRYRAVAVATDHVEVSDEVASGEWRPFACRRGRGRPTLSGGHRRDVRRPGAEPEPLLDVIGERRPHGFQAHFLAAPHANLADAELGLDPQVREIRRPAIASDKLRARRPFPSAREGRDGRQQFAALDRPPVTRARTTLRFGRTGVAIGVWRAIAMT